MVNVKLEHGRILCNRFYCERAIGLLDFDGFNVILINVRDCVLSPYSTVTEYRGESSPIKIMVGSIREVDDRELDSIFPSISSGDDFAMSLMRVSDYDFDVTANFSFVGDGADVGRSDLSLICSEETLSADETRLNEFIDGVTMTSTPRRKNSDATVESAVAEPTKPGSSSRAAISIGIMPKRKLFDLSDHDDLATILPGEKVPKFE